MSDTHYLDWPFFEQRHGDLARRLDAWATEHISQTHGDDVDAECKALVRALGQAGWLQHAIGGTAYGGAGDTIDTRAICLIRETLARHNGLADFAFAMQGLGSGAISLAGTDAQKQHYLPRVARGEAIAAFALSEPDAGSDVGALQCSAEVVGDEVVLNGTKTWISNGIQGSCFALLVKTDPKAEPRYKGMSFFIAPKGDGFTVGKKFDKMGYKGIDSAELNFDNYRIPADHLIGGVEGEGFFQATGGLELGRINVAARGVGLAEGSLRLATEYAQIRKTMGKPIAQHQAIQLKLGEMVTRAEAARLLVNQAAEAYDRGERCDMEAGMAKFFASEAAVRNSEEAMRIFGGYSYSKEYEIERYYRDALLMCIGEGTNEMQRMIIAKQWLKRNPA